MRAILVAVTVVVVLAILGGVGAWFLFIGPAATEPAASEEKAENKKESDKKEFDNVKMKPIEIPVIEKQQIITRLQIIVKLKVARKKKADMKKALPAIRQAVVERLYTLLPVMMDKAGDLPDKAMVRHHVERAARRTLTETPLKGVIIEAIRAQ